MIESFKCRETEIVAKGGISSKFPIDIHTRALRKIIMLNSSKTIKDLLIPPSNHLEKLKGDREGSFSIRINDKYRICFKLENNNFTEVEIVDYH